MANKETTTPHENPFRAYTGTANDSLKEFWSWQIKTSQSLFEQSLQYAQTYADFAQTQLQESARLSQEIMKMGLSTASDLKKTFTDAKV